MSITPSPPPPGSAGDEFGSIPTPDEALEILQDWLNERSRTWLEDDFEGNLALIRLPLCFVTKAATFEITTEAEMRLGFEAWRRMIVGQSVTQVWCRALTVCEISQGHVTGTHETRILKGAMPICAPFTSTVSLREDDGIWRATTVVAELRNGRWPVGIPRTPTDPS